MLDIEAWDAGRAAGIVAAHRDEEGGLLPILHDLQRAFGHIPEAAIVLVASALNLTRAEVYGVVSFYHDFREHPAGRHVLKLCQAEACQSRGGEGLAAGLLRELGIGWGGTTADGGLTVEPVYCLGLCATAPSALLDEDGVVGRLDEAQLRRLAAEARQG
jgi:formate dehydrogenase subunit gamma